MIKIRGTGHKNNEIFSSKHFRGNKNTKYLAYETVEQPVITCEKNLYALKIYKIKFKKSKRHLRRHRIPKDIGIFGFIENCNDFQIVA